MKRKGGRREFGRILLKTLAVMVSIAVFCTLGYSLLERHQRLVEVEEEIAEVKESLEEERKKQQELTARRDKLRDPEYIELLARQELGLIRPDDVPYQWTFQR